MKLQYAARSVSGQRDANQDAVLAIAPVYAPLDALTWGLFAVADGMGGYTGGELASALTIRALADVFQQETGGNADVREAIALAQRRVCERKVGRVARMGSTVALLQLRQNSPESPITATVAHVGDSRVYRLRDNRLSVLTCDHSLYAAFCQAAGAENAFPDYRSFAHKNVITRAVGMPDSEPDVCAISCEAGDMFLLCSDGLIDGLSEPAIAALLEGADGASLDEICTALTEGAENGGSRDNISVVLAKILGSG